MPAKTSKTREAALALADAVEAGPVKPTADLTAENVECGSVPVLREMLRKAGAYNGVYKLKIDALREYAEKVLVLRGAGHAEGLTLDNIDAAMSALPVGGRVISLVDRRGDAIDAETYARAEANPEGPEADRVLGLDAGVEEAPAQPPVAFELRGAVDPLTGAVGAAPDAAPEPVQVVEGARVVALPTASSPERLGALLLIARDQRRLTRAEMNEIAAIGGFSKPKESASNPNAVWYTRAGQLVGVRPVEGEWAAINLLTIDVVRGSYQVAYKAARAGVK